MYIQLYNMPGALLLRSYRPLNRELYLIWRSLTRDYLLESLSVTGLLSKAS